MRRQKIFVPVLAFLALALPALALTLLLTAVVSDHFAELMAAAGSLIAGIDWHAVSLESSARWPELAGMAIGQLLIMLLILLSLRNQDSLET